MRATLTTMSVVALLGAGAGTAAARPADLPIAPSDTAASAAGPSSARTDAAVHASALRSQGLDRQIARDRPTVAATDRHSIVRVTAAPRADGGFDWLDAGIGAGLATALLLSAAGVSTLRRQRPMAAR